MGRFIEKNDKLWLWSGGGIVAGLAIGFAIAHIRALREWPWDILAQPLATLGAATAAIIAAAIALHNGEKTREQDKEIHEAKSRAEQERALRERFTSIVEMLSTNNEDYTKRESGAYALAALADDWTIFYKEDPESAQQEQQVCLNILTGQLRDPISENSSSQLLALKERIQDIIFSRFTSNKNDIPGTWSSLKLDLSNCHLYKIKITGYFNQHISFYNTNFVGESYFTEARFTRVNFNHSQFHNATFFSGSEFYNSALFQETNFHDRIKFHQIKFHGPVNFFDAKFYGKVTIFEGVVFYKLARFSQSRFYKKVYFSSPFFFGDAYFDETEFHATIRFESPEKYGTISFSYSKFYIPESHENIEAIKKLDKNLIGVKFLEK